MKCNLSLRRGAHELRSVYPAGFGEDEAGSVNGYTSGKFRSFRPHPAHG
jgi:hypothetical protein